MISFRIDEKGLITQCNQNSDRLYTKPSFTCEKLEMLRISIKVKSELRSLHSQAEIITDFIRFQILFLYDLQGTRCN